MGFEPIRKRIVLSIDDPTKSDYIQIKQGFIGTLQLIISFLYQGKTFVIPEGTTAILKMLKPDKHQVLNSYEVVGNSVIVNISLQMQKASGDASFEVILMNEGQTIPSSTCKMKIVPNVHDDSNIKSTDEYVSVIEALTKADKAIKDANTATDNMTELIGLVQSETLKIYKQYVNTYNDIATTYPDPETGWMVKTVDTGNWYRYSGTEWIMVDNDTLDKVGDLSQSTTVSKSSVVDITNEINANKLDKDGDSKNNTVTFDQVEEDTELQSGMTHATLWGLVKLKFANILTTLANKIDKNAITHQTSTNDPDKIPSSQVTSALADSITKYNHTYPDSFGGQTLTQILDDFISNNYKSALCFYWEGQTQPSDTVGEIANNRINALYEFYRATTDIILVRITTSAAIYSKIFNTGSSVFIPWVKATNTLV